MNQGDVSDGVKVIIRHVDTITTDDLQKIQLLKTAAEQLQQQVNTNHMRQYLYNSLTKR